MVISLSLVLVDGTSPVANTPTRQNWTAPQGADVTINGTLVGSNGTAVNITGYTSLLLTIRTSPSTGIYGSPVLTQLTGSIVSAPAGTMTWSLPGASTKLLTASYFFDVFVTDGAGKRNQVLPMSFCNFTPAPGA